jgi:hypothetical protein
VSGKFRLCVLIAAADKSIASGIWYPSFLNPQSSPPAPQKRLTILGLDLDKLLRFDLARGSFRSEVLGMAFP